MSSQKVFRVAGPRVLSTQKQNQVTAEPKLYPVTGIFSAEALITFLKNVQNKKIEVVKGSDYWTIVTDDDIFRAYL